MFSQYISIDGLVVRQNKTGNTTIGKRVGPKHQRSVNRCCCCHGCPETTHPAVLLTPPCSPPCPQRRKHRQGLKDLLASALSPWTRLHRFGLGPRSATSLSSLLAPAAEINQNQLYKPGLCRQTKPNVWAIDKSWHKIFITYTKKISVYNHLKQ